MYSESVCPSKPFYDPCNLLSGSNSPGHPSQPLFSSLSLWFAWPGILVQVESCMDFIEHLSSICVTAASEEAEPHSVVFVLYLSSLSSLHPHPPPPTPTPTVDQGYSHLLEWWTAVNSEFSPSGAMYQVCRSREWLVSILSELLPGYLCRQLS